MNDSEQETICYTIEREFLAKITVAELVNLIIHAHVKEQTGKETVSP